MTIALLLDLVGVPTDLIVEDYALSAGYFASPVTRVAPDDWRHRPLVVDSPPEFMASALEHLDRVHGGAPRCYASRASPRAKSTTWSTL